MRPKFFHYITASLYFIHLLNFIDTLYWCSMFGCFYVWKMSWNFQSFLYWKFFFTALMPGRVCQRYNLRYKVAPMWQTSISVCWSLLVCLWDLRVLKNNKNKRHRRCLRRSCVVNCWRVLQIEFWWIEGICKTSSSLRAI